MFFLIEEVFVLKAGIVWAFGAFLFVFGFLLFLKCATEARGILQDTYFQKECRQVGTLEWTFSSLSCLINFDLISGLGKKMGPIVAVDWKENEM